MLVTDLFKLDVTFYVNISTSEDLSGHVQSRMQCDQVKRNLLDT